jgi:hypothetical protein
MSRLVHSVSGSIRSMQISKKRMFLFVEGALDRTFYDQLLRSQHFGVTDDYEIRAAKELPGNTGGKPALMKHFRTLKQRDELAGERFGKRYTSAFIFDKDIDDLSRKKLRSPHAIYTSTYDLEGHLITCGDLVQAISIAAGITYHQALAVTGRSDAFLTKIAGTWVDWIALCILSQLNSIAVGCTFDRPSPINPGGLGATDLVERDRFIAKLAKELNISTDEASKKFRYYVEIVNRKIARKEPLRYFKGKWIRTILQEYMAPLLTIPGATVNGLGDKVLTVLVAQIAQNEACKCCFPFYGSLQALAETVAPQPVKK